MLSQIFISYNYTSNAKALLNNVCVKLSSNGYTLLNEYNDDIKKFKIDTKITTCELFICCLCNKYLSSIECLNYMKKAADLNKPIIFLIAESKLQSDVLDGDYQSIIDKYDEFAVDLVDNKNSYFELINAIGMLNKQLDDSSLTNKQANYMSIKGINYKKTVKLNECSSILKIFQSNDAKHVLFVEQNPLKIHVYEQETFKYRADFSLITNQYFKINDLCLLNGYKDTMIIIGTANDSIKSYIYLIDMKTFKTSNYKEIQENYNPKGLDIVKIKKKYFNSCAEKSDTQELFILETFKKPKILVYNYNLEYLREIPINLPINYSNVSTQKLFITKNNEKLFLTNSLNRCGYIYDLKTMQHMYTMAETLFLDIKSLHEDDCNHLMTVSWNNPYNGLNIFNHDSRHLMSFNFDFGDKNKENRLYNPIYSLFTHQSNELLVIDGNFLNVLHVYSVNLY